MSEQADNVPWQSVYQIHEPSFHDSTMIEATQRALEKLEATAEGQAEFRTIRAQRQNGALKHRREKPESSGVNGGPVFLFESDPLQATPEKQLLHSDRLPIIFSAVHQSEYDPKADAIFVSPMLYSENKDQNTHIVSYPAVDGSGHQSFQQMSLPAFFAHETRHSLHYRPDLDRTNLNTVACEEEIAVRSENAYLTQSGSDYRRYAYVDPIADLKTMAALPHLPMMPDDAALNVKLGLIMNNGCHPKDDAAIDQQTKEMLTKYLPNQDWKPSLERIAPLATPNTLISQKTSLKK